MNLKQLLLTSLLATLPLALPAFTQDHGDHEHAAEHPTSKPAAKAPAVFAGEPYLLDVDVVTGKALGPLADQVKIDFEGRELRFSSEESAKTFRAAPAAYVKQIDALMIADQMPLYPLTKCMVTGETLGSEMGDAVDIIYKNRLVRFCCKKCIKKFHKDPNRYIAELDAAAIKAQMKDYPFDKCMISGDVLGAEMGDVIDRVVGGRLVRYCCKMCIKKLAKDPAKYIGKLDAARGGMGDMDGMGEMGHGEHKDKGKSKGHDDHEGHGGHDH